MNEYQIVSLISLLGFLILVGSAFGARDVSWKKGLYMAASWAGIFAISSYSSTWCAEPLDGRRIRINIIYIIILLIDERPFAEAYPPVPSC